MTTILFSLEILGWYLALSLSIGAVWGLWCWWRAGQQRRQTRQAWQRTPILGPVRVNVRRIL